ncbi:hypothetical protein AVEN_214738-1 [Araneus ventricosus]|uniref:Uncharacterized protein n=1 Tax=Araneus ventricosus TaxID=182803 RepID=A0A4Y2IG67_ARAVE|nr:hypothetical protein AVEN_214738-1 [Araneus ventricosus]
MFLSFPLEQKNSPPSIQTGKEPNGSKHSDAGIEGFSCVPQVQYPPIYSRPSALMYGSGEEEPLDFCGRADSWTWSSRGLEQVE